MSSASCWFTIPDALPISSLARVATPVATSISAGGVAPTIAWPSWRNGFWSSPGEKSTNRAPKKSVDPTDALASTRGFTSDASSSTTSTRPTRSSFTLCTRPFLTPDTITGSPCFRPLTLLNTTSALTPVLLIERPVSQNSPTVNTASPISTSAPTPISCLYVRSITPLGLDDGHLQVALQELQHRGVLGLEDLLRRPHRADLRLPQQCHAVGDAERAAYVVRHDDAGHAQLLLQPLDQPVDHVGVHGIQARRRLVVQQIGRLARDGARDADALPHPARQLRRILVPHLGAQVHEPQALFHPVGAVVVVAVASLVGNAQPDILVHGVGVEQRAVLEDVADLAAQLGELPALEVRDRQPVHDHVAGVGLDEADDVLQEHALPHPGGPEQRHRLALAHDEVHVVQDHVVEEALGDLLELDHWLVSNTWARTRSRSSTTTEAETTACVVAFPTPSAPCWVLN